MTGGDLARVAPEKNETHPLPEPEPDAERKKEPPTDSCSESESDSDDENNNSSPSCIKEGQHAIFEYEGKLFHERITAVRADDFEISNLQSVLKHFFLEYVGTTRAYWLWAII